MYKLKYGTGFCRRYTKEIQISYIHIVQQDKVVNDGQACAEAKLHHLCLERDSCLERNCSQNNIFGQDFLQKHYYEE